jgi:outer membrane lipoprotein-sorting protein
MSKALIAIAAGLALASLGSFVSGSAQAGGASSAPSKYSNAFNNATSARYGRQAQSIETSYTITEFSSSSAKTSAPKR